jgi:hypothetical protein
MRAPRYRPKAWPGRNSASCKIRLRASQDLIRLRVNLSIAKRFGSLIQTLSRREINLGKRLGLGEAKPDPLLVKYFCSSLSRKNISVGARWWRGLSRGLMDVRKPKPF